MKTINTNSKAFKQVYFQYILDSINFEDFDPKNDKERMELFWVDFDQRANYPSNKKRTPNLQNRIEDFLQGLPYDFKFASHEILEMAVSQGSLNPDYTEKQADRILSNYWNFTAFKIIQLSQSLGINTALFA